MQSSFFILRRNEVKQTHRRAPPRRWAFAPVTFFVAPSSRDDVGVLAGRPRHDSCPQSLMIRGVMSPGLEGGRDIANRGRAEVLEADRNVDAEL